MALLSSEIQGQRNGPDQGLPRLAGAGLFDLAGPLFLDLPLSEEDVLLVPRFLWFPIGSLKFLSTRNPEPCAGGEGKGVLWTPFPPRNWFPPVFPIGRELLKAPSGTGKAGGVHPYKPLPKPLPDPRFPVNWFPSPVPYRGLLNPWLVLVFLPGGDQSEEELGVDFRGEDYPFGDRPSFGPGPFRDVYQFDPASFH